MTTGLIGLFLVGPVVLVPLWMAALPRPASVVADRLLGIARRLALPTGLALAVAFALPTGPLAGALALGWLAMASLGATGAAVDLLEAIRHRTWRRADPDHAVWVALPFLAVSAGNVVTDRLGIQPFGFSPTIILLTAIHFIFAGFVLILAGAAAYRSRPSRWLEAAIGSVIVGIPVTAAGFFGVSVAAWIGALLVAGGGLGIGFGHLVAATRPEAAHSAVARSLTFIAGLALLLSMPLAAIYATGVWSGAAWLDLPTMARTHGAINVLAFALPATIGWALARRSTRVGGGPADPLDVIGFNLAPFVVTPIVAASAAAALLPAPWSGSNPFLVVGVAGLVVLAGWVGAILVIVRTYGPASAARWDWIAAAARSPRSWLNLTTGFDDSTAPLRARLQGGGRSIDLFEEGAGHDAPIRRARRSFPPSVESVPIDGLKVALDDAPVEAIVLAMAAHELHGSDRSRTFAAVAAALAPRGRLILVEHLRDRANVVAFGPGAWHFATRADWLATADGAGLRLVEERRLGRWVRGFVFERA